MTNLGVVVPARNEADLLPDCLAALSRSRAALRQWAPQVSVRLILVLDCCVDASAQVAQHYSQIETVTVDAGCVGGARQAGIDHLLRSGPAVLGDWFACTDADSAVPADWLITHYEASRAGIDLLLGSVRPDRGPLSPKDFEEWQARHDLGDGHGHVFGANLGFGACTLSATGGFRPLPVHEDVDLTSRTRAAGLTVVATGDSPVITSARRTGRTPAGFASYLLREFGPLPDEAAAG